MSFKKLTVEELGQWLAEHCFDQTVQEAFEGDYGLYLCSVPINYVSY